MLSYREQQVWQMRQSGMSVQEVAEKLGITKHSVNHQYWKANKKRREGVELCNTTPPVRIEVGRTYGMITVLSHEKEKGKYICRCKCGNTFLRGATRIFQTQEVGCAACSKQSALNKKIEDAKSFIGTTYGDLEIIDYSHVENQHNSYMFIMKCRCKKCGAITKIPLSRLKKGGAKQCATCSRKNLDIGREISQDMTESGTLISAIDGRRNKNKNNTSGYNGVSWHSQLEKWRAYITFQRKQYSLGVYDSMDDAIEARKTAEKEIYGNFLEWYAKEFPEKWERIQKQRGK